jgi:hypothetical protein
MSQNQIKYLATLLMLLDHIGLLLEINELRFIGRLSFPLFCWILARNWERRGEKIPNALIGRLLFFGIISQFPYILLVNRIELNILLSFLVCVLTFSEIHKTHKKLILLSGMAAAQFLNVSYGWFAVACPLLMISFKGNGKKGWWFCWISTNILYTVTCGYLIQIIATVTPLILMYHNPAKDRKPTAIEKKFFYYFYPIHLAGLAAIRGIIL